MMKHMENFGTWSALAGKLDEEGIRYPLLAVESLGVQAERAVLAKDIETLRQLIQKVHQLCSGQKGTQKQGDALTDTEREAFRSVFGDGDIPGEALCIAPANIDLILDNIFEQDGRYEVIDCEWIFDFPVPVDFLIWRAINELYAAYPNLEQLYAKEEFLGEYGITSQTAAIFWRWATYFTEHYVGANRLLSRSIPKTEISLEKFRQKLWKRGQLISGLYLDTGNGFSEKEMLLQPMEITDGSFTVTFDLSEYENLRSLRFDPLEGSPCICQIAQEKTTAKLTAVNAAAREMSGDLFLTTDPIYLVKNQGKSGQLTISGRITVLSMEKALNRANQLLKRGLTEKLAFWKKN
jgi:hypothetical protein